MLAEMLRRLQKHYREFIGSGAQLFLLASAVTIKSREGRLLCLALLAIISLFAWIAALRRRRAIVDTPTSRIVSAAQGLVELHGHGRPIEPPVLSHLYHLPCLWYRFQVEEKDADDRWAMVNQEESAVSFIVDDGSACCVVDVEGAEILTRHKEVRDQGGYRTTEWTLQIGDPIYARGEFRTLGGGAVELDTHQAISQRLAEWKNDPATLLERFDLNGDGQLDINEWQLARQAARREVARAHHELRNDADVHILRRPRSDHPYLISNLDPARLARRYLHRAMFHLLVFLVTLGSIPWVMRGGF